MLPAEFRRPEEKKRREERPEVKLFIPPAEAKSQRETFTGRFFGTRETPKPVENKNVREETDMSVFKMQKEPRKPLQPPPPPPPPRSVPPPVALRQAPQIKKEPLPPPKLPPQSAGKGIVSSKNRMGGITLIPEEKTSPKEAARPKQKVILAVMVIILVAILGGVFGILAWYSGAAKNELAKIEKDVAAVEQQIKNLDEAKNRAQTLQKQFQIAEKLLNSHVYWTGVYSFLEKNTIPEVYFKNFVGGSDGQISMSGVAKSYKAVAGQIVSLREAEKVEKVSITSASASVSPTGETAEVNFDVKLKLNPEIFLK